MGGDYLLTLKGNHKLAHKAVVEHFDQHCFRRGAASRADCDVFDDTHGRLVRRRVFASTDAAALEALSGWPGLRTVLAVESIRSVNSAPTKVESEIRYFLSSCPDDPAVLEQVIRSHWAVENALHWVLDVTFSGEPLGSTREDDSRVHGRTAARNLALLRKIALNIVGRDKTTKASVRARRKKAAWNDARSLEVALPERVAGARRESRVQHHLHGRHALQAPGELLGHSAHVREAHAHGLDAAERQGGLIRRHADADHAQRVLDPLVQVEVTDSDRAEQQVGVAADILGQGLDREVGAVDQGFEQQRRSPGVVAANQGVFGLRRCHDGRHVLHLHRTGACKRSGAATFHGLV